MTQLLDDVDRAIKDIAAGRPVLVVDDENRENEGDIIFAASHGHPRAARLHDPLHQRRDLRADARGRTRPAPAPPDDLPQHRAPPHRLHGQRGRAGPDQHRHLGRGPRRHDRQARRPGHHSGRPGAPRPRVPAPLRRGRRAAPGRAHRGRRGPGPAGRAAGGGRAVRGGERRRHDGPAARAARVREHPRPGADLDRAAHRVPPPQRAPAQPPGADQDPERLRPVAGVRLPARDRRHRVRGAGARRRDRRSRAC